ncbi:hypothetical protein FRC12_004652 [Ceratobasidium sp. 428]|nr:hypothetical protein FRC12_004652 [Ceratobasidium sp. 428]
MSETSSEVDALQGYDRVSARTQTPELVGEPEETVLHRSPFGHPSAAMRVASEPVVQTRPDLPPFRSFDRPVLRRDPSDVVTPQTDSNLRCVHMMPVCYDRSTNEDQLAYTDFARPWEAMTNHAHWDFEHGGVVGARILVCAFAFSVLVQCLYFHLFLRTLCNCVYRIGFLCLLSRPVLPWDLQTWRKTATRGVSRPVCYAIFL